VIMPMTMPGLRLSAAFCALIALAVFAACGGGGDSATETPGNSASASAGASSSPLPTPESNPLIPPLEGPDPGPAVSERTDWREDPEWALPSPDDVSPADNPDDPVLNPPADPECPVDWAVIERPDEGFKICHPASWIVAGHGYVSPPNEDRWYSLGIFNFVDEEKQIQRAHVSVYVFPPFARPVRYTIDCPAPASLIFAGEAAVVCPSFPGVTPESEIISYQVRREDRDYFVNVTTYPGYDAGTEEYSGEVDPDVRGLAVQIAQTFQFIPIAEQPATPSDTAAQ
jgi:hypothetical protein